MSRVIKANQPVPVGNSFIQMKAGFTTRQKKTLLFWLPPAGIKVNQHAQVWNLPIQEKIAIATERGRLNMNKIMMFYESHKYKLIEMCF